MDHLYLSIQQTERTATLVLHSRADQAIKVALSSSMGPKAFDESICMDPHEVAEKQVKPGEYDLAFTYEGDRRRVQRGIRVRAEVGRKKQIVIVPRSRVDRLFPVLAIIGLICGLISMGIAAGEMPEPYNNPPHVADFEPALAQFTALNVPSSPEESIVPPPQDIYIPGIPPVGTIVAFAGPVSEIPDRWYLCDGRSISKDTTEALFEVIGSRWGFGNDPSKIVKLPDLRGQFLRGVDSTGSIDPACRNDAAEGDRREKKQGDGESPLTECTGDNLVGTYQGYSTALPKRGFVAEESGEHNHGAGNDYDRLVREKHHAHPAGGVGGAHRLLDNQDNRIDLLSSRAMQEEANHTHDIIDGGDAETRPVNAAVHWIIYAGPPQKDQ